MITQYIDAEDEIFGVANTAWKLAIAESGLDYNPKIFFPGQIKPTPDVTQIYADCSFSVVTDGQVGLNNYQGLSLYETVGLMLIQIFSPKLDPVAQRMTKMVADKVRNAFCKPSPSMEIWFRQQKLAPVSGNPTKNQVNVVVTCSFRTAK